MKVGIIGGISSYLSYLVWNNYNSNQVELYSLNTELQNEIIQNCPSLTSYRPPAFYCGFLHTLIPTISKPKEKHISFFEKIGDTGISVDFVDKGQSINSDQPLLLIIPGLTGKVQNGYVNSLITQAHQYGFNNICIYTYRMLSKEANFLFVPPFQDYGIDFQGADKEYFRHDVVAGQTTRVDLAADLHYTLKYLKDKYKFKQILAIGCSYGGVQLGNYLGRFQDDSLIDAGVTVCSPHNITDCENNISTIMDLTMTYILRRGLKINKHLFYDPNNYPKQWKPQISKAMNSLFVHQFDRYYTSQVYGYKSEVEYYKHFSSCDRFPQIKIPMLCIAAKDDYAVNIKALSLDKLISNKQTIVCLAKSGGHIGFLEGLNADSTWFPKPALEFLQYFSKEQEIEYKAQ
ncbi:unnamed protein product [Paramecium pentaurelia]|uniref:AB hydrolase-1 domain-containing protein n=1 Tax=Paramecium pentaurelia TaxID=43138 RepID=A0A8S1V794_9CILI|nr:unnamed protein product [Paramecium pentaurelia]